MTTWKQRFRLAVKSGKFTLDDCRVAADWNSCAVGETHPSVGKILRDYSLSWKYSPSVEFDEIFLLGMRFYWAVNYNDIDKAKNLYKQIEDFNGKLSKAVRAYNKEHKNVKKVSN